MYFTNCTGSVFKYTLYSIPSDGVLYQTVFKQGSTTVSRIGEQQFRQNVNAHRKCQTYRIIRLAPEHAIVPGHIETNIRYIRNRMIRELLSLELIYACPVRLSRIR